MAMWKIWNCQTLHKSLEITNALIAVHVTSQTLYTEITNAVHVIRYLLGRPGATVVMFLVKVRQ